MNRPRDPSALPAGDMTALKMLVAVMLASETTGFSGALLFRTSGIAAAPFRRTSRSHAAPTRHVPAAVCDSRIVEGLVPVPQRGASYLRWLLFQKRGCHRPSCESRRTAARPNSGAHRRRHANVNFDACVGEERLSYSGALVALPLLGRLFGQASNLFQVGALFGTVPTLLAGLVCSYWAWQVSIAAAALGAQHQRKHHTHTVTFSLYFFCT